MPFALRSIAFAVTFAAAHLQAWGGPLNFCYEDVPQAPWTMPSKRRQTTAYRLRTVAHRL